MKQIIEFLEYDGGEIKKSVMYTGNKTFRFFGKCQFRVYGTARLNGNVIKDTEIRTDSEIELNLVGKESAIVFYRPPLKKKEMPEFIPVSDPPEFIDDATLSIYSMIEDFMRKNGLLASESEPKASHDDVDMYDDEDDYEGPPLDEYSLLAEPTDILESDISDQGNAPDSGVQQTAEILAEESNELVPQVDDPGMRDAGPASESKIAS